MTDHRWQGVPAISTCWDGATSAEACNIYAERFYDLREPRTTPAPGEPARRCEEYADVQGRGRFTIRTTDQGNVVLRHNGAVIGYFGLPETARAEAQRRVPGIMQGGY